jgi:shikimate dehydrogenase
MPGVLHRMNPAADPPPFQEADYVSGRTRLFAIVGHPIAQVRSPAMFSGAFRARGLDALLVPLHVAPEDFDAALPALLRLRNLGGLIFTVPFKARAVMLASSLGRQARTVGAINALARDGDQWKGEIFDGLGCVEAFRRHDQSFEGKRVMLAGCGGAGAAMGVAIAHERPAFMRIFDVDRSRAEALAGKVASVSAGTRMEVAEPRADDVDILLNATPVGMLDDARLPFPIERLPAALTVFDVVVVPERTPLIELAERCGCRTIYGYEMTRGQMDRMVDFFVADGKTMRVPPSAR